MRARYIFLAPAEMRDGIFYSSLGWFLEIFLDFISLFYLWGVFVPLLFLFVFLGYPLIGGSGGFSTGQLENLSCLFSSGPYVSYVR